MQTIKLADSISLFHLSDAHEHADQFEEALELIKPDSSRYVVFGGDAIHKGFGNSHFERITKRLIDLKKQGFAYAIRGNHELKEIRSNRKKGLNEYLSWWDAQPLAQSFSWNNGQRVTVVHGGVALKHSEENITTDPEVCYVRNLDEKGKMIPLIWKKIEGKNTLVQDRPGKTWHEIYNGRFGYIIAGHAAQKDGKPKFYNYSCNIDSACYETGLLTCLPFSYKGRGDYFQVSGPASNPDIGEILG